MSRTKKIFIWIFVIIVIGIIIAVIWFIRSSKKKADAPKSKVKYPSKKPTSSVPAGSVSSDWIPESFPLNVGMYGPYTQQLQAALGLTQDQEFGTKTADAVRARGVSIPIQWSDYVLMALVSQTVGADADGIIVQTTDFSSIPNQVKEGDILGTIQNVVDPTTPDLMAGLLGGSYLVDTSTSNPHIEGNIYVKRSDVFFTDLQ